ncbi:MAG: carbamoyltransferase [Chitinophagales bacterium]|nr:carbamoyltransferase [Chitinophagales bacterium]
MTILGISAFYHDSAAAIIQDGKIMAAAQEERFTRKKHDESFPINAVKFCLQYCGLQINEVDAIAFYDKPLLKFERLLETYYGFAPKGLISYLQAMPVWLREKMFLKRVMHEELEQLPGYDKKKVKFLFPEHHLSHAASAFYSSPFQEAAILTLDGVGEWATASISKGSGNSIEILKELRFPHSPGLLYSAFTYYLGFKVNSGEYKMMGLAPYGIADSPQTKQYIQSIKEVLIDLKPDGSLWLNQEYFNYATGLRMADDEKWQNLFGFKRRNEEDELLQHHCNMAYAIQAVTEELVLLMAAEAKRITNCANLCMAGGVALNCVANGKLLRSGIFENLFVQPAAGDAGGAVGAAQAAYFIHFGKERIATTAQDEMQGAYLGPEFSDVDVEQTLRKYKAVAQKHETVDALTTATALLLNDGNVVGWFQGRMEFGPRALGNRSILGDARNAEMQKKLNLKIKYREGFRPFAPSVLAEEANEYFELDAASPYMLIVAPVKKLHRKTVPDSYHQLPMMERLYTLRSDLPAITHVDFSARVQTIHPETNPRYYQLLKSFKQLTGYGLLVNTSFNVRGEPPVCTPDDAYKCFMRTEMDYLVLGNYVLTKSEQPNWQESSDWKKEFTLD